MAAVNTCKQCGEKLKKDEKAVNLKLISRDVKDFYCIDCLAKKLGCERKAIDEYIEYYRNSGNCTLFR